MALTNTPIEGWAPDRKVAKWARRYGFGPSTPLSERELRALSASHGGHPTGLYLWEDADDHAIYIGISTDSVTKRLRSHVREYPQANIQAFYYRPDASDKPTLRDIEQGLIYQAIDDEFVVYNTEHSSAIYGDSVFDDVVPVSRQRAWFADPAAENLRAPKRVHAIDANERKRSNKKYPAFTKRDDAERITDAISLYLRCCVPFPYESQIGFWTLTALPNVALTGGHKRVATLSMGMIEMLWFNQDPDGNTYVRVSTDYRFLPPARRWGRGLRRLNVRLSPRTHRNGGPNEMTVEFGSVDAFIEGVQTSQPVRVAAARYALDRIRRGRVSGRFRDAHNYLLTQDVLDRVSTWQVESRALDDLYDSKLLD